MITVRSVTAVVKKKNRSAALPAGPEFVWDLERVPAPERKAAGAHRIYFPFDVMEVGRSFTSRRTLDTVRKALRRFKEEGGPSEREYSVRGVLPRGCRCWRTK